MHAVRPRGQRDVQPVVHDYRHAERRHQPPRQRDQLTRIHLLEPELHRGGATALCRERERDDIPPFEQTVVSHEHQSHQGRYIVPHA